MSTPSIMAYEDSYGHYVGVYVHMDGDLGASWIKRAVEKLGRDAFVAKFITGRVARSGWSALYSTDPTAEPSGYVGGYGGDGRPVAYSLRTDCVEDVVPQFQFYRGVTYNVYTSEKRDTLWQCSPDDWGAEYGYLLHLDGTVTILKWVADSRFEEVK